MKKGRRASERRREKEGEDNFPHPESGPGDVTVRASIDSKRPALGTDRLDLQFSTDIGHGDASGELEKTHVNDKKILDSPSGAQLISVDDNRAHPFLTTPAIFGRHPDVDLVWEGDPAISRQHIKFTLREEQPTWLIEDLGSLSGTLLNGELVELPSLVKHGDHIIAGQTELRFMWCDQEPEKKIAPTPLTSPQSVTQEFPQVQTVQAIVSSKPQQGLKALVVFFLIAVTGLGAGVMYVNTRSDKNPHIQLQIDNLLQATKGLLKEMKFTLAQERLDTIFALDDRNAEAMSLQKMVDGEKESQAAIDEAEGLKRKEKFMEMKMALSRIPDTSLLAPLRDKILRSVRSLKRKQKIYEIEELIRKGQLKEAKGFLSVYVKDHPKDKNAKRLWSEITRIENKPPPRDEILEKARGLFRAGNIAAAKAFSRAKAAKGHQAMQSFFRKINSFETKWKAGKRFLKNKDGIKAGKNLEGAYRLATQLAGHTHSVPQRQVGFSWADALYLVGIIELRAGRNCHWARSILRATELRQDDPKVISQRRRIDRQAKAALQRAKAKRSIHPAEAKAIVRDNLCFVQKGTKLRKEYEAFLE